MCLPIGTKVWKDVGGGIYVITGYTTYDGEEMYRLDNGLLWPVNMTSDLHIKK